MRSADSNNHAGSSSKGDTGLIVGIVVACVLVLAIAGVCCYWRLHRQRKECERQEQSGYVCMPDDGNVVSIAPRPPVQPGYAASNGGGWQA